MRTARRALGVGAASAAVAAVVLGSPAASFDPPDRSIPVVLSADAKSQYGQEISAIVSALYNEYVVHDRAPRPEAAEAVAELSHRIPMSDQAQAELTPYASRIQTLGDPASLPKLNFVPPAVTSVTVTPVQVTAARSAASEDIVVDVEVMIVTRYTEGPSCEELIDYLVVKDPESGVYTSLQAIDQYVIDQAHDQPAG